MANRKDPLNRKQRQRVEDFQSVLGSDPDNPETPRGSAGRDRGQTFADDAEWVGVPGSNMWFRESEDGTVQVGLQKSGSEEIEAFNSPDELESAAGREWVTRVEENARAYNMDSLNRFLRQGRNRNRSTLSQGE
jgi:hypothetical protein